MIKKIFIGLAALVVLLLVVASFRPSTFTVSRSAAIPALPGDIFPLVNDVRKFQEWSPWAKLDPECKVTFHEKEIGTGAMFTWQSKKSEVGAGKMTIVESDAPSLVRYRLDFLQPFSSTSAAQFEFQPDPQGTQVTWTMKGECGLVFRVFGLFMDFEKAIGTDFEKGLVNLADLAAKK